MSKPEFSRPFNLEHAKAGAPFCCRDGVEVEILKWDRKHTFCIVGLDTIDASVRRWRADGSYNEGFNVFDLVMLPLGFIDGKPVWTCDEIVSPAGSQMAAWPSFRDFANCAWPAPVPVYPTFDGSIDMLAIEYNRDVNFLSSLVSVANFALRHAIDAGQVVLPDATPSDDLLMKVAKEVWCRATGQENFLNEKEKYFRAIIASVTSAKDAKEGAK